MSPIPPPPPSSRPVLGPYTPTLILHGGAGSITRSHLPPPLYNAYRASLLTYLHSTHALLVSGTCALTAACDAVALFEDDALFNCGRGSVFTDAGTIEMEASVMVCSVNNDAGADDDDVGGNVPVKRGAAVSLVRGTRHPVLLAREVLLAGGEGRGKTGSMHCHLSGEEVEKWGWGEKGLERKGREWFWTEKRWREHLRGLGGEEGEGDGVGMADDDVELPSQGTVGAVCMDSWGNLAVATSTGGLTNKKVGRIGDTPTLGAGFWAESWNEVKAESSHVDPQQQDGRRMMLPERLSRAIEAGFGDVLRDCMPTLYDADFAAPAGSSSRLAEEGSTPLLEEKQPRSTSPMNSALCLSKPPTRRRAVAMSGTGNGDSFLRTSAVRTAAAMCRFDPIHPTLAQTVTAVAGPDGELQQSAGDRWQKTGEGEGGIIGIELASDRRSGNVVFDFNCGGLWRAWIDEKTNKPRVMVFKREYEA